MALLQQCTEISKSWHHFDCVHVNVTMVITITLDPHYTHFVFQWILEQCFTVVLTSYHATFTATHTHKSHLSTFHRNHPKLECAETRV